MIILDTNVISELMRARPDQRVLDWLALQPIAGLFTTALTQAEVFYGMALLPHGKRQEKLASAANAMFDADFAGRILPFDSDAARNYPDISAGRRLIGQPISQIDGQIAAITASRGARLATRNVRDFADCGIVVVDPWSERQ